MNWIRVNGNTLNKKGGKESTKHSKQDTHFSEGSVSTNHFELIEQCVITPTHAATVSDILLKKMCMFSLSQLGMLLMHGTRRSFCCASLQLQWSLSQLICFSPFILSNKMSWGSVTGTWPDAPGSYKLPDYKIRSYMAMPSSSYSPSPSDNP